MKRIGIYVRVSTEEQAQVIEGSIKNQKEMLKRYIEGENLKYEGRWGVLVDVYVDEGFSAKNLNRPGAKRLILDIDRGLIDTVLITEISRLSRAVKDWIDLRQFFADKEAAFIASRQNFDTSNAMGRAMLNFAIEFAQLEREMTAERVKASYHARAGRGLWTGGLIPYGLEPTDRKGYLAANGAKKIVGNEIMDILLHKAGYVTKAVEILKERGYKREGGIDWDEKSLTRWVRHHAIIGKVELNAKNKDKDQDKLAEAEKYKVVDAVWDAVVDEEKWIQANELLDRNYQHLKVEQWRYNEFILTGLIECPNGKRLVGSSGTGRSGKKYANYKHSPKAKCDCHVKTISAPKIEKAVLQELSALTRSPEVLSKLVEKANEDFDREQPDPNELAFAAKRRLDGVLRRLDKISDQILDVDEDERKIWVEKLHRVQQEKRGIEAELAELEQQQRDRRGFKLDAKEMGLALAAFTKGFHHLPVATKQAVLTAVLSRVMVEKDEITVEVVNPGFSVDLAAILPVNRIGGGFAQWDGWLLRTDLNRRPSD